ncbi:MAG: insulinase family protein [Caldilineae bacterium]|nr:MAG: insulinase family protein [Caldilineae bacterium]
MRREHLHDVNLPGPHNLVQATLDNGMQLLIYESWASETVVLDAYVPGGIWAEPPDKAGLAYITAGMLRRGAAGRTFDQINEMVESVGASFGFECGRHILAFDGKSLAEDFPLVCRLLADALQDPLFAADQFEQLKAAVINRIRERDNNPRSVAHRLFREHLYPAGHPYHRSLIGYIETVSGLGRDEAEDYYRRAFTPQGGWVVVCGAIQPAQAIDLLAETVGQWQVHDVRVPDAVPRGPDLPAEKVVVHQLLPGKSQNDIVIGWPGIYRRHPDYFPLLVCNAILGSFGLGGRLGQRVREEQGLAYYAYSSFSVNRGTGTWYAVAGVNPKNVQTALSSILEEITRIRHEPVTDEELADVKANLTGSLPLRLESHAGIAGNLLTMAWYELGLDFLLRYAQEVNAVGKEDVLRVAQTYLHPERYVLAVAGPEYVEASS